MRVGIPIESAPGETRVATVPEVVPRLKKLDLEVLVARGAGAASGFRDEAYADRGATLVDGDAALDADVVLAVAPPDAGRLKRGTVLLAMLDPLARPERVSALAEAGVTAFALELVPRISRAQSMDVLSSMANVAGYKAVLLAANASPKLFPMMMTAAGTVRPARVFVLGAGVAGLQAIATARRLGAVVEAYDIRPDTKEQVESLGARFVEFDLGVGDMQDEGGYARELTDEQKARQSELMAQKIQETDAVVTTANVPGRRAPLLITAEVVEGMKPGAVVVDMAAETGGNCAVTKAGEEVEVNGVRVLGPVNLPAQLGQTTSQLYANNLLNFVTELVEEGELKLDLDDEIQAGALVCHEGQVVHESVKEASR